MKHYTLEQARVVFLTAVQDAINVDDWTDEFKKNLYEIKKHLLEIEILLD